MKRTLYTLLLISFSILLYGQSAPPQGITYQAVLIDKEAIQLVGSDISGRYLANEKVEAKFTIVYDQFRIVEYVETHETTTDAYGLINLVIGQGTPLGGDFTKIKWEEEPKYLKVEVKLDGEDWELFSLERLWSVPYALYTERSKYADSLTGGIADRDSQLLSIVGDSLFISNGNAVFLPKAVDTSNTNEFQDLLLKGDSLLITNGKGVLLPNDEDVDSTNELQDLSLKGDTLLITKGKGVLLPIDEDLDSTNELQRLVLQNDTLLLSNGNQVLLTDLDPNNEIQKLSFSKDSILLSNGGGGIPLDSVFDRKTYSQSLNGNVESLEQGCIPGVVIDLSPFCSSPTWPPLIEERIADSIYLVKDSIGLHYYNLKTKKTQFLRSTFQYFTSHAGFGVLYTVHGRGAYPYTTVWSYLYELSSGDSMVYKDSFYIGPSLNDVFLVAKSKDLIWMDVTSGGIQDGFNKYSYSTGGTSTHTNPNKGRPGLHHIVYSGDTIIMGTQLINARTMAPIRDLSFLENSDFAAPGLGVIYIETASNLAFYDVKLQTTHIIGNLDPSFRGYAGAYIFFRVGRIQIAGNLWLSQVPALIMVHRDPNLPFKLFGYGASILSNAPYDNRYVSGRNDRSTCISNKMLHSNYGCYGFHGQTEDR